MVMYWALPESQINYHLQYYNYNWVRILTNCLLSDVYPKWLCTGPSLKAKSTTTYSTTTTTEYVYSLTAYFLMSTPNGYGFRSIIVSRRKIDLYLDTLRRSFSMVSSTSVLNYQILQPILKLKFDRFMIIGN